MKKLKILTAIFSLYTTIANAQCALPTGYNFENFISTTSFTPCTSGWSSNIGGTFTYATGQVGLAGRLDISNEYVQINTADAMGVVSYYLKGWNTGGAWQGTFKLQESVNGSSWNDLTVLSNAANIAAAPVTAQEINVKQAGNTILSGGNTSLFNSPVGTPTTVAFTIENLGSVSTLSISSISITGSAAADYSVSAPATPTTPVRRKGAGRLPR